MVKYPAILEIAEAPASTGNIGVARASVCLEDPVHCLHLISYTVADDGRATVASGEGDLPHSPNLSDEAAREDLQRPDSAPGSAIKSWRTPQGAKCRHERVAYHWWPEPLDFQPTARATAYRRGSRAKRVVIYSILARQLQHYSNLCFAR